ncbi:MAG: hypothetical protein JOZ33_01720, partial [Acidobacteriaceae bacterium]|nr:hypothetical protein [Acidobacteriaceae bacterium]
MSSIRERGSAAEDQNISELLDGLELSLIFLALLLELRAAETNHSTG